MTEKQPAKYKDVFTALVAAQEIMEPLIKGALNPAFKGEGKPKGTAYADLSDVVATVRQPFADCGLAHFSHLVRHDGGMDWRTVVIHGESGTRIECDVPMIVDRQNMQGMKSAVTYAKRVGLESLSGLAPEDDDGNAAAAAPPPKQQPKPRDNGPTDAQIAHDRAVTDGQALIESATSLPDLQSVWSNLAKPVQADPRVITAKDQAKARLTPKPQDDLGGDNIPY